MQPNWRDEVYLEGGAATGAIEVTSFLYFNTGNPEDKDDFDRKVITNMLDLGEDLNQNLFAAENAASNEGKVRHTKVPLPQGLLPCLQLMLAL